MWIIATFALYITKLSQKKNTAMNSGHVYRLFLEHLDSTIVLCIKETSTVEITWGDEKMLVVVVVVSNSSPLTRIESISPSVSRRFRKARNKFQ
jgi:hypothetical protein